MEAFKNYVDLHELVSSITRLVNNLDKLTEIMTTTSIKMDPVKAKAVLNEWYGNIVMDEVSKKFWAENEKGKLQDEIQDLKLENDRLKRRNELMEDYIHALACIKSKKSKYYGLCDNISCPYYDQDKAFGEGACTLGTRELIEQKAADLIEKLEDL